MMRSAKLGLVFLLSILPALAKALDPVAPTSERQFGIVMVKGPNPKEDIVKISNAQGKAQAIKEGADVKVPIGDYQVHVQMQEYHYDQTVTVQPTERTDVMVPGYGNLKVNGYKGEIRVYQAGTNQLVARFNSDKVKTVPTGEYDVKISIGSSELVQNIWVVTNTTRYIDVKLGNKKGKNG